MKKLHVRIAAAVLLACTVFCSARAAADLAADIEAMTGAHTKIVWLRADDWREVRKRPGRTSINEKRFKADLVDKAKEANTLLEPAASVDGGGKDTYIPNTGHWLDQQGAFAIWAFDTRAGKERQIVPQGRNYNPLITPDGGRIVYTTGIPGWQGPSTKIRVVNWDGTGDREVCDGYGEWVWCDQQTGTIWVYYAEDRRDFENIWRVQLDKTDVKEKLYDGRVTNRFSVSADGTRAGGEFPHPNAGMLDLRTKVLNTKSFRHGCNTYLAPDNSYRMYVMLGSHDTIIMYHDLYTSNAINVMPPGLKAKADGGRGVMWNPKWASDARHLSIAGPFGNLNADQADIWLAQFAPGHTAIAKWVQVTNSPAMDTYAHVWIDPGLGRHEGKAPLTVKFPSAHLAGKWQWTYGDGSTGDTPEHTYTKPGEFAVIARQGNNEAKGSVIVHRPSPPRIAGVQLLDETRVRIAFDERVQLKEPASVKFDTAGAAKSLALDADGRVLVAEFARRLDKSGTLVVDGVWDSAQVPNRLPTARMKLTRPAWPVDRSSVLFLWQSYKAENIAADVRNNTYVDASLVRRGSARFDGHGGMLLRGGVLNAIGAGADIVRECRRTNQFTLQAMIETGSPAQGTNANPARIIGCNRYWGGWEQLNFMLCQEADKLVLRIRTKVQDDKDAFGEVRRVELFTLIVAKPVHVIVSYADGRLVCYADGKPVKETNELKGELVWDDTNCDSGLNFGGYIGTQGIQLPWRGRLEGLGIFSRSIEKDEAQKSSAAYAKLLAARPAVQRAEVEVVLMAATPAPTAAEAAPYREALVVNEYQLQNVIRGSCPDPRFRVVQWGLLDAKPTAVAEQKVGANCWLTIEPLKNHPELESELTVDKLPQDLEMPVYYCEE